MEMRRYDLAGEVLDKALQGPYVCFLPLTFMYISVYGVSRLSSSCYLSVLYMYVYMFSGPHA
jgi:hypothetical protein